MRLFIKLLLLCSVFSFSTVSARQFSEEEMQRLFSAWTKVNHTYQTSSGDFFQFFNGLINGYDRINPFANFGYIACESNAHHVTVRIQNICSVEHDFPFFDIPQCQSTQSIAAELLGVNATFKIDGINLNAYEEYQVSPATYNPTWSVVLKSNIINFLKWLQNAFSMDLSDEIELASVTQFKIHMGQYGYVFNAGELVNYIGLGEHTLETTIGDKHGDWGTWSTTFSFVSCQSD